MRNLSLSFLLLAFSISTSHAQSRPVPPASIGFKAGVNSAGFKLRDFSEGIHTKRNIELVSGVFANIPITQKISVQPELLYSVMGGQIIRPDSVNTNQKLAYLSVPLQAKIRASKSLSILAGPQFDFLTTANFKTDEHAQSNKDEIVKNDFALTAGLEYDLLSKVLVSARYIHGFKNVPRDQVEGSYYNRGFQLTIGFRLGNNQHAETKPGVAKTHFNPDEDKDGVNDLDDKCPLLAGSVKYNGCPVPDSDSDGVNDEEDQCPNTTGLTKYRGCPIPDTDKDGINDEQDQCPAIFGVASNKGCPFKDRDADGIADDEDNCPDIPGSETLNGCPVIETRNFNSSSIQFLSGSTTLTEKSRAALDEGAALLQTDQYKLIKVEIAGYTDKTGRETANRIISKKRAEVVKAYLVSKGVDASRITANGYGSQSPIADNATPAGRSKNRRVEFRVSQ